VAFTLNDSVRLISGPRTGELGATISLLLLDPEPIYLVELGSGAEVSVPQSSCVARWRLTLAQR
jgi:hypothetical protein